MTSPIVTLADDRIVRHARGRAEVARTRWRRDCGQRPAGVVYPNHCLCWQRRVEFWWRPLDDET
jgi:hypothetical protein